ncbi:QueT transporter family protein [Loigolactobacillus backii]|uniref:QueT transporter family protein n=1 Tax=Loigolactobacillus backii TaxID=375175 RepID=UPI0007F0C034|nr:QueT transporter family protein [Loigolactobacillus backii]ANK67880.1 hypothetical protein AYR55_09365 [Loigolactobacillus backii]OLF70428.1 membrane protein [Loigolactobacillus backii]PIO86897.1 hypothetical protein B8A32_06965 [Loigolactobacillus backii]
MEKTQIKTATLTKAGLIAGLYVAISLVIAPYSFGAVQFRFAEMFNHLAVFNKRYIWALTLGCLITNFFSPLGVIDVVCGTLGTLVMTTISYFVSRYVKSVALKLTISTVVCTLAMWSVALELHVINHLPFWPTYLTVAIGELASMVVGGFLIYAVSRQIDLTK